MKIIARIHTDFKEKFGIPRQSGIVKTRAFIEFEPEYNVPEAVRGLDGFSHIWLLWQFSESVREDWSPTVRPPRLGGNARLGVFATRSPFRPNPIGMSVVELERVEIGDKVRLHVRGADLLDGTPIYDIKPYLPYADCISGASGGFANTVPESLDFTAECERFFTLSSDMQEEICAILRQDPRPKYKNYDRVYGMKYGAYEIKFKVEDNTVILVDMEDL